VAIVGEASGACVVSVVVEVEGVLWEHALREKSAAIAVNAVAVWKKWRFEVVSLMRKV